MSEKMRIMTERPLNAETPISHLRSWITSNAVFFDRNQGEIPQEPVSAAEWRLLINGLVEEPIQFTYDQITRMPKAIACDKGASWQPAAFIGPREKFAWRQWEFIWGGQGERGFPYHGPSKRCRRADATAECPVECPGVRKQRYSGARDPRSYPIAVCRFSTCLSRPWDQSGRSGGAWERNGPVP